jgi:hypothetical protein
LRLQHARIEWAAKGRLGGGHGQIPRESASRGKANLDLQRF